LYRWKFQSWLVVHSYSLRHRRTDWLICIWVQGLSAPMHLGLDLDGPFVPHIESWEPRNLTIVPDGPQLLISSGSKKKESRYACLSEAKACHSHRMWAEVFCPTPHFLHMGVSSSPSRQRCLLWELWPVRRTESVCIRRVHFPHLEGAQ